MELSNDWHKRTNVKLVDILSDILKELRPPKVGRTSQLSKPSHGYTIAEKEPEVVTAPGVYFPEKKGEVIPLTPRQAGGEVTPTRTLQEKIEKLASYAPFPIPTGAEQSTAARQRVEGQGENRLDAAIGTAEPRQTPKDMGTGPGFEVGGKAVGLTGPVLRQGGGGVDPSLFSETFSVGPPNPVGDEKALANLSSFAPTTRTPTTSVLGQTGLNTGYYDAHPGEKAGVVTPTTPSTPNPVASVNPANNRLDLITGALRSFLKPPPAFRENRSSPIFGSDQKAAYDKKWKPYTDFMKATEETPLFSRAPGGATSPDPFEGLSEEEQRKLFKEVEARVAAKQPIGATPPDAQKNIVDLTPNVSGTLESKTTPQAAERNQPESGISGNLSEIKKDILPSGETRYTLPGTEGTATVGAERFFVGKKEVPAGTPGAISGDELARRRIFREATPENLKLPEKTYYETHPEERFMDLAREENKPLMDAYQKLIEENKTRAQGFGLPMNPKAARLIQGEAAKAVPELTQGYEKMMALNEAIPEKYYNSDARIAAAEARAETAGKPQLVQNEKGEFVHIYPPGTTGGKPTVSPTGVIGQTKEAVERNPTELGLIAKSGEKGPDGKPTADAIIAQKTLDAEKTRKLDIQSGGIPQMGNIPTTFTGQYNEAALEGLDPGVVATIKKLVKYEIPLPSGFALKVPYWQNALARASAYDPTWDVMQYPVKFGVRKSFTSGKDKDNIVALNTVVGHINSLVRAKDELANSNWQMGNTAINILAKYFPVTEGLVKRQGTVTGVKTKFNAVKGEMANIFKRSGATDQEIKSWNDTVSDPTAATPASWNAFIGGALELMGSRIEALKNIYERGIGSPKDFAFLSPKSRTILKGLGVDVNAIDPVTGAGEGTAPVIGKPQVGDFGGNPEGGGIPAKIGVKTADDLLKKYEVR